jgi:glucan biosynthesis protein C
LPDTPTTPVVHVRSMYPADPERRQRLLYFDRLRVCVIALVFVVHVCQVFNPWDEWHITNADRSPLAGELVMLLAPWIMPLAMLLGGVSAWHSLQHRGNLLYLRERTVRLFLPLVMGTLLLVPPQVYLERRMNAEFQGSFLAFYPHFFEGIYPRGNLSWHHLWFLAHLYGYSILTLPLFRFLQRPNGWRLLHRVARIAGSPHGLMWLAVPLILERNLLWGLFPERHMLTSDWSNHALLFVAYAYGFVLAGVPSLRAAIRRQRHQALFVAAACSTGLVAATALGFVPDRLPAPYSVGYIAFWTLYAFCAWAWLIALLGIAQRWLDEPEPGIERFNHLSYGWYVLHQPIIVAVAFVVVQRSAALPLKFAVIFAASLAATVIATAALQYLPVVARAFGAGTRRTPGRSDRGAAAQPWPTSR